MPVLYANNAASKLSASITNVATSFSVTAGEGAKFPAVTSPDYFYATLMDSAGNLEVVKVTARAADTFTVTRAQDGTTGRAYSANDIIDLRITKSMLDDFKTDTRATALALSGGTLTGALQLNEQSLQFNNSGVRSWSLAVSGANLALAAGDGLGAFSVNGTVLTGNTGTVTSVATSGAITGGPFTTSGTISHATTDGYLHIPATSTTSAGKMLIAGATAGSFSWQTPSLELIPDAWTKKSVRAATTANITLSAPQTIDGIVLVAGDRVLVKDQTTASTNGIYLVAAAAWTRALDADTTSEMAGACVNVDSGTVNGGLRFDTDLKTTDVLGTTALTFSKTVDAGHTTYIGTTAIALGRTSAAQALTGITSIDGSAATLTTARTINGVSFNGSANITVADSTKLPLSGGTLTGNLTAPTFYSSGTTYYLKPHDILAAQTTTAGSRIADLRFDTLWKGSPANSGPILTHTLTSGGTGYAYPNGTYTRVVSGGQGVYATFDFVLVGGVITGATLVDGGAGFQVGDTISIAAATLGGTGSGGLITVNTVRDVDISLLAPSARIRLGSNRTGLSDGVEIGGIYFNGRDPDGAGDRASILGVGNGIGGAADLQFLTSSSGQPATLAVSIDGSNNLRIYNLLSTLYTALKSSPTANRTLTFPDATGTIALTSSSITGSAATLTTARTINGVSFNGSANITVADSTKLALSGGTLTGALAGTTYLASGAPTIGQFMAVGGSASAWYNAILRNDGNEVYLLSSAVSTTQAAANTASWNTYRPLSWSLTTGILTLSNAGQQTNVGGSLTASGNVTAYSDERLKKDWADLPYDFVERLAKIKSGTYTRIDTGNRQAGASAQGMQGLMSEVVSEGTDDAKTLSLAYGNAALVSAIELAKRAIEQASRIERIERQVQELLSRAN